MSLVFIFKNVLLFFKIYLFIKFIINYLVVIMGRMYIFFI